MIIDCAVYHSGTRIETDSHRHDLAAAFAAATGEDFVWLGLYQPTAEELQRAADVFGLHPLAVEDAVKAHQRPKLERYGDGLFMVLKTLWYVDAEDAVETGEVNIFLGQNYIVSVRHGRGVDLSGVRKAAEESNSTLGHGPAAAMYAIVDGVVDRYSDVTEGLENDVAEVEQSVFSDERTRDAERIYRLKREAMEVRRAVIPLRIPVKDLAKGLVEGVPKDAKPFFRDVADHLDRVSESIDSVDHLLDNALNAHLARISVQQNDDMRKISAGAALFLAPTLVAGIYGMNFTHMPELHWWFGYPMAIGIMLLVSFTLFRIFKKSGWL
ncbi:MAG: magnesium/cobalt transporter CorA [Nocardioidaceae bacterium]